MDFESIIYKARATKRALCMDIWIEWNELLSKINLRWARLLHTCEKGVDHWWNPSRDPFRLQTRSSNGNCCSRLGQQTFHLCDVGICLIMLQNVQYHLHSILIKWSWSTLVRFQGPRVARNGRCMEFGNSSGWRWMRTLSNVHYTSTHHSCKCSWDLM